MREEKQCPEGKYLHLTVVWSYLPFMYLMHGEQIFFTDDVCKIPMCCIILYVYIR